MDIKSELQAELQEMDAKKMARRSFVKGAGLTGLSLAGAAFASARLGVLDGMPGAGKLGIASTVAHAQAIQDQDIGNFALNLEYLEAEFYTIATTGKNLEQSGFTLTGSGQSGPTTGGNQVSFKGELSGRLQAIAEEITYDEQQHVLLLRGLLGPDVVAKPAINLDALGFGFGSFQDFLKLSRAFEDTGASAYGGAAPLIQAKGNLSLGVRIGLTEAYHVSNLRLLIAANNVQTTALDSLDVLPPPSGTKYFTVDSQARTIVRTTSQVLAIVYGNSASGTSSGGFFPNGVNGLITTV